MASGAKTSFGKPEIKNRDMLALKGYITAKDDLNPYEDGRLHPNTLLIDLTHSNLLQRHIEIRFDRHDTIATVKQRIHQTTGTPPHFQRLVLKSSGQVLQELPASDDPASSSTSCSPSNFDLYKLGYFFGSSGGSGDGVNAPALFLSGLEIHCIDVNAHSGSRGGQYEDTSLVERYVMTEDAYNQRKGTLRDWGRQQKEKDSTFTLAKHAKEHREMADAQRQHKLGLPLPPGFALDSTGKVVRDDPDQEVTPAAFVSSEEYGDLSVAGIVVGQRCQVEPGSRRGSVSFVGLIPELPGGGYWVGITFDEPVGKTDGSAPCNDKSNKKKYFDAMPHYGGFSRGKNVQVGDYPERDIFDEMDDVENSDDEL